VMSKALSIFLSRAIESRMRIISLVFTPLLLDVLTCMFGCLVVWMSAGLGPTGLPETGFA